MLAIERRNEILEKLQTDRRVVVSELSQLYDVSEETIRRDLEKLVNDGYAIKSYGGAVINENINIELPFNIRKNRNILGKQHIAELVAGLVNDGDSIMLLFIQFLKRINNIHGMHGFQLFLQLFKIMPVKQTGHALCIHPEILSELFFHAITLFSFFLI